MLIQTLNNQTINTPKTYLSSNVTAGTSVIPVRAISPFQASWAVQIGETGEQQTEVVLLSSNTPSGTIGTLTANTVFDHSSDTPLYGIKYDQLVFERSTIGTLGTATPLSNGTINLQVTGTMTYFDDTSGSTGYAYKTYYRNSALAVNSSESDWITTAGFPFYSKAKIRQRIKGKLVSAGYIDGIRIDDSAIDDWINEWLEVMTNAAIDVNEDYSMGTMEVAFASGSQYGIITAQDFKQPKRVWYSDGSGTWQATKMDSNSFSPNKTFTNTFPYFFFQGDSIIGRQPFDASGTFSIEYYKLSPVLVEDTDQLPVSMWGYTKSFVDYGHSQALFKDSKPDEAAIKLQEAAALLQRFRTELAPRSKTGATYIEIVEEVPNDGYYF